MKEKATLQVQHNIKRRVPDDTRMEDYINAGCRLYERPIPGVPFVALWQHCYIRREAVCLGCEENCDAVHKLAKDTRMPAERKAEKTNAQWAAELGVSKRQVAKMRKRGELK